MIACAKVVISERHTLVYSLAIHIVSLWVLCRVVGNGFA